MISGTDDDEISNDLVSATINAGDGDDTIKNDGKNVTIMSGDGNDLIADYAEEDTIPITSDKIKNITANNTDVIFTIGYAEKEKSSNANKTVETRR